MTTFTAVWKQSDALMQQGETNAVALQVGGTNAEVVWLNQSFGDLVVPFSPTDQYGVYSSTSQIQVNVNIRANVIHQANLGSTYTWDGYSFSERPNSCPADSVTIHNNTSQIITMGLTKQDPMHGQQNPVCADSFFLGQSLTYTPTSNLYAIVGHNTNAGTVLGNVSSLQHFQISTDCEFNFDAGTNQWVQTDE